MEACPPPLLIDVECSGMIYLIASWMDYCTSTCLPPAGVTSGFLFPWILWNIWKARNRFVFKGFSPSPEDTLSAAITLAREWSRDQKPEKAPSKKGLRIEPEIMGNSIVVKTDAAWNASRQAAGMGWILTSNSGSQSFKAKEEFVSSPLKAEALVLRPAIFKKNGFEDAAV